MPPEMTNDGIVPAEKQEPIIADQPAAEEIQPEVDASEPNFDEFLSVKNNSPVKEILEDKTSEEPAKQPEIKKETSREKAVNDGVNKIRSASERTETPFSQQRVKQVDQRDYSGIEESDVPLFKQMSNEAFNRLKKSYIAERQYKDELAKRDSRIADLEKGKIPDSYYEHPQSFVLTPEFVEASNTFTNAQNLSNHWHKQLAAIREGADTFKNIEQVNGQWQVVDREVTAEAEAHVISQMAEARQTLISAKASLTNLSTTHQSRVKESLGWASQKESEYFPVYDKPEYKEKYEPVIKDTINKFPPTFQKSPLARMLAKSLIMNFELSKMMEQQMKQSANPAASKVKVNAGPTVEETGADTKAGTSNDEVSFADFERLKNGL